jgi:hypothetical protein
VDAAPITPATLPPPPPVSSVTETPRRQRLWPAALALYFLSPSVGEVISGSTPPLLFLQPFGFIFTPLLYGSSAILIHEVVVRRRLNWGNVLLLGAAFGIFQEALIVQTWFTYRVPTSPSYGTGAYGALWGINWLWAVELTLYHAFISIATPLILLGVFFPRRSRLPWLGPKRTVALLAWLLIPCGLLAAGVATTQFAKQGYHGPPLAAYLACVGILLVVIALGVFVRFSDPRPDPARRAPGLWAVRLTIWGLLIVSFLTMLFLPSARLPAILVGAWQLAIFAFGLWRVRSWSARAGWDARHWLAVATGVVMYFTFPWAPAVEFLAHVPARLGLTAFDLLVLLALALYAHRLNHRTKVERGAGTGIA